MARRGGKRGAAKMRKNKARKKAMYGKKRRATRKETQQRKRRRKDEDIDVEEEDHLDHHRKDTKGKKVKEEPSDDEETTGVESLASEAEYAVDYNTDSVGEQDVGMKKGKRHRDSDNYNAKGKEKVLKENPKEKKRDTVGKTDSKGSAERRMSKSKGKMSKRDEGTQMSKGSESKPSEFEGSESMTQTPEDNEQKGVKEKTGNSKEVTQEASEESSSSSG